MDYLIRITLLTGLLFSQAVTAEPYLAVKSGHACAMCHVSPTGGGMRTEFGQAYGRSLAASQGALSKINPQLSEGFRIGANFRGSLSSVDTPGQQDQIDFTTDRASFYLQAELIPQTLTMYIDQQFSPASDNREAWLLLQTSDASYSLRAGQFFLPYGLRLEDDSAFIRQVTGINFAGADNGVELGFNRDALNAQFAMSNGTVGAVETNTDKQLSLRAEYILPSWRIGGSVNSNHGASTKREMFNLFAGLNLFSATWLLEVDRIRDTQNGSVTQQVFFAEVNKEVARGHNIKLTLESHDPNTDFDEDERTRNSLVWEYFPIQQMQLRSGFRLGEGIPQRAQDNSDELFVNLHAWF